MKNVLKKQSINYTCKTFCFEDIPCKIKLSIAFIQLQKLVTSCKFQGDYDFHKYAYEDDLTSSQELEMLAAIQGSRSADFEPANIMSPSQSPQPRHTNPAVLPPSAGILVTHADTRPSSHDAPTQPHSSPDRVKTCRSSEKGHGGARASRDSPTLLSDEDDTSYSTWKAPVGCLFYSIQCNTGVLH